jgi:hypothetical protein
VLEENELAIALSDVFLVSLGQSLVVPRRLILDFFCLFAAEIAAVVELLFRVICRSAADERQGVQ